MTDLRPLRGLRLLADNPMGLGLTFKGRAATRADPRIAEIAVIEDKKERTGALFAYLEDWVPPGEAKAPEPDALLPVDLEGGRLEIAESLPSEAERDKALKRALHDRLRQKGPKLAQLAGNYHPRLAARARSLAKRIDTRFEEVDMLLVHLDVEDLKSSYDNRNARTGVGVYSADVVV